MEFATLSMILVYAFKNLVFSISQCCCYFI